MQERVYASELTDAIEWLNTDSPLSLRQLRGNVVILDFWTYCCINCMHVLPVLAEIEHRHKDDPLVVIGVHSGKFDAERDPSRIREAIHRYGISHPVAVDDDMAIWSQYAIRSWPTLVIIRPDGTIAAVAPGEPEVETLDAFVTKLLSDARASCHLNNSPPALSNKAQQWQTSLKYPGKVSVLNDGKLLLSDSGNNRLVLAEADGTVCEVIGSGMQGLRDGSFENACFDDPQGTCVFDGFVYVADTRNHAIRKIDLHSRTVETVAGTGKLGRSYLSSRQDARIAPLRSPWDLVSVGEVIYIAMAGTHQLWKYYPAVNEVEVFAGTGAESLIDGDASRSAWAQPSGMSELDGVMYVADSETSAIRTVNLKLGKVGTLFGKGLFNFGDKDGNPSVALLQHCLGIEATKSGLYIADTYNGKLKHVSVSPPYATTLVGGLSEPGSVRQHPDGYLVIADTNAHRIVKYSGGKITEIKLDGLEPPLYRGRCDGETPTQLSCDSVNGWFTCLLMLDEFDGFVAGNATVTLVLQAPDGCKFSPGSPVTARYEVSRRPDLLLLLADSVSTSAQGGKDQRISLSLSVMAPEGKRIEAEIVASLTYVLCTDAETGQCTPCRLCLRIPVRVLIEGGQAEKEFNIALSAE